MLERSVNASKERRNDAISSSLGKRASTVYQKLDFIVILFIKVFNKYKHFIQVGLYMYPEQYSIKSKLKIKYCTTFYAMNYR